jgi:PAS domain S-box-containing protein
MDPADSNRAIREDDATLLQLGLAFTSELDIERLAQLVIDKTRIAIGAEVGVFLHRAMMDELRPDGVGWSSAHSGSFEPGRDFEHLMREIVQLRDRHSEDPNSALETVVSGGVLALPILAQRGANQLLGRLYFGHREPLHFTSRHERFATAIAARVTIALENAIAFETLRRSRDASAAREHRYAQILDSVHDMIFCIDANAHVVYANASASENHTLSERFGREITGMSPLISGATLRVATSPGGAADTASTELISRGYETSGSDEQARYFHVVQNPIRDRHGHIVETVAIARDITEDRRQKELERRVAERTHALAEANRALADANRELESFSYTVSHDLRAPIRHISGFVDLLGAHAASSLDEKGKRWLRTIADASRQMGALIDALLSFSRMGRSELEKGKVDLENLVTDVLVELEPDWRGRRITWKREHLPVVRGDATMLRIVFTNLLSNAVKYTRAREEALIEIGADDDPLSSHTTLWVRDNGIGFDMEYSDKLFGVFQRLHSNAEAEGTGIGLATVRRIIERHGGRAWAYGVPGHGATFYLTLPRNTARDEDSGPT